MSPTLEECEEAIKSLDELWRLVPRERIPGADNDRMNIARFIEKVRKWVGTVKERAPKSVKVSEAVQPIKLTATEKRELKAIFETLDAWGACLRKAFFSELEKEERYCLACGSDEDPTEHECDEESDEEDSDEDDESEGP